MQFEVFVELFPLTTSASAPGTRMTLTYCLLTTSNRSTCTDTHFSLKRLFFIWQTLLSWRFLVNAGTSAVRGVQSSSPLLCWRSDGQSPSSWSLCRCLGSRSRAELNWLRPPWPPSNGSPSRPRGSHPAERQVEVDGTPERSGDDDDKGGCFLHQHLQRNWNSVHFRTDTSTYF